VLDMQSKSISSTNHERSVLLIGSNQHDVKLCLDAILAQSPFYGVVVARPEEDFEKVFAEQLFDLIALDYDMPGSSNGNLVERLHKLNPQIPIIVMTNSDSPDLALQVLRAGASDFLPKIGSYEKFLPRTLTTNLQRAMLLENLREMYQRVEQSSRDEAALNRMIVNIHSSLDLDEIIERAAQSLSEEFKVSRTIICTILQPGATIRIARQVTKTPHESISEKSSLFSRYHDLLLDVGERRPLVVMHDDTFAFAQEVSGELCTYSIKSMLMVPLVYRGKLMGLVHLDDCDAARLWTQSEINLLSRIANQLSIAISQGKLYQIVENQSQSIDKLTDLCGQLNTVVHSTRELTERQESREKMRVRLSTREIEVLRKVAQGLSNKEIADSCHITEGTTEVHVSRLRKKLALSSRAALVRYAYENHLI
jgi:DNA-binding NarL/FixJ family response regulator